MTYWNDENHWIQRKMCCHDPAKSCQGNFTYGPMCENKVIEEYTGAFKPICKIDILHLQVYCRRQEVSNISLNKRYTNYKLLTCTCCIK